ncbi:hypothetical protein [Bacteroides graminisolvens]|jgi:hypothetical protein|uniref:DUF2971 domain-containing protein n=1 Tax=Bacteroides graminisolvens DSM 19988 = JCM 15093 TaxID=1121097 RepID=A0A069D5B8_9BACE|nr:hypothetical protein [Bacteroides graminisolvens]MBP9847377.1 hypothetical protein [Saprospiraceae bacterium]GAK37530.1 hypothetical protein JCM15093_2784 [Bacteroides graminisolvens DSM 19988 = JCM 15093]HPW71558.1 hypothetical protein [Bacteroides graminisolvens]
MKIHHYTNLESLAMILKNRTIRFNRLDKVDDLEEGNAESLGVRFCKYVFVSCWTEISEESIPLWKMYGGDFGGIRISVEKEMFQEYFVSNLDFGGLKSQGFLITKIPPQSLTHPDFWVFPMLDYNNDLFYRHVEYVDDVFQYTKDCIQITNIKDGRGDMNMQMKPFGSYKNKRWGFQNETRFVLYVLPCNPMLEGVNPEVSSIVMQSLLGNKSLPFTYYDMQLKDEVLEKIEITLSPSASEAEKIITQALIDKYAPKAQIKDSALGKVVRLK